MTSTNLRIIYNAVRSTTVGAPPTSGPSPDDVIYIPSDRPVVECDLDTEVARNSRQQAQIDQFRAKQPTVQDDLLDWAYRCFRVTKQNSSDPGTFGDSALDHEQLFQNYLYLFNVIVALEWRPSPAYLQQLETTFRRASNFLYDVTDGYMAFGQVVFGGSELMQCADIQIMASNRFNPRSWVSGLREPQKYMPIRIGRGVWHKNNRVCIPWDEPEGYRTLVHEWAHYALELRDEYLEPCPVLVPSQVSYASMSDQILVSGNATLIIPKFSLASESIMATLEGTSELVPRHRGKSAERKRDEWEIIAEHFEKFDPEHEPLEGPSELPLPLPRFYRVGSLENDAAHTIQSGTGNGTGEAPQFEEIEIKDFPKGMQFAHCWVYVIQGTLDAPQRIIGQGTLDARASDDGMLLLGAHTDDTVVLIGADNKGRTAVMCGVIALASNGTGPRYKIKSWRVATPTFPLIDVLPEELDPNSGDQLAQISVRISGAQPPSKVWIFPLGQIAPADSIAIDWADIPDGLSAAQTVPTLDGHILVRWPDDTLVISTYSQGGGPQTGTPTGPPPISAGSSEGNVMLFFENKDQTLDYSDVRVVTTLIHGMPNQGPDNAQARGYTFSLASNQPLPVNLNPTLVMHFDKDAIGDEGDMLIHQHAYDDSAALATETSRWLALPTYLPPGASFVAVPLNSDTADRLTDLSQDSKERRVEHYRLYWRPRDKGNSKNGSSIEPVPAPIVRRTG